MSEDRTKKISISKKVCLVAPIVIGLFSPSIIIFFLQYVVGGISASSALTSVLAGQFKPGENLFLLSVVACIPFALLSAILLAYSVKHTPRATWCLAISGLTGILVLMIPAHVSIWYPLYGPGRMSSTAVIGFIFIPIYCIGTMGIGLLLGWVISLSDWFQIQNNQKKSNLRVRIAVPILVLVGAVVALSLIQREKKIQALYRKAVDDSTTVDELKRLAKIDNLKLKEHIISNNNTDAMLLRELINDPRLDVFIARQSNASEDILRQLAKKDYSKINEQLACNHNTPSDVLEKFTDKASQYMKQCLAENPNTPVKTIEKIYNEKTADYFMFEAFAKNPSTPAAILEDLFKILSKDQDRWRYVLSSLIKNPNTPKDIFLPFAFSNEFFYRESVAANPKTPQDILELLGKDKNGMVRQAVARNPNLIDAPIVFSGIEILQKPKNWKVVKTAEEKFLLVSTTNRCLKQIIIDAYSFKNVIARTGAQSIDLDIVASDIPNFVGDKYKNPTHQKFDINERTWGNTVFEGQEGWKAGYLYTIMGERILSIRYSYLFNEKKKQYYEAELETLKEQLKNVKDFS